MHKLFASVLICFCLSYSSAQSNQSDSLSKYLQFETTEDLSYLITYFPPFIIQHCLELKAFIRSNTYLSIRKSYGDLKALDALYIRSMSLTNDNTAVALLISMLACFDHRIVGLKVPIFALYFPLSNESEKEFTRRVNNLPKKIYSDSPSSFAGDRDKLQHFFGAAFLSYLFESRQPAERVADFIEQGEDAIIVDGALDERDMRANWHGEQFGLALLENQHRLPSEFLVLHIASQSDSLKQFRMKSKIPQE